MTAIDLPAVSFQVAYPQIVKSVSASRAGGRAISFVEYADDYWSITMRTKPLRAAERLVVEAFRDAAQDGLTTIIYTPKHMCLPKAFWGDPSAAALANGMLTSVTDGRTLAIGGVDNGLILSPGDLISLTTGDYHALCRIGIGGAASENAISVTVDPPVAAYIDVGALVRFKKPLLNCRVVPGSFSIPDDHFPVASFTLVEVPK